jgi:hypothetical protein
MVRGTGLAQFIVVFGTAAFRKPALILIDEPELNLHPTLQLSFLTNLGALASTGLMFSTHSIGLARNGAEHVYAVTRRSDDAAPAVRLLDELPRLSEFLGELSVGGYKEVGFDAVLLVEGATEIRTIQQLLRALKKEHQFLLLPLGGSALINGRRESELAEIKRITPNVIAIVDSERSAAESPLLQERQDFVRVCGALQIRCAVLERRAIENYFTPRAIRAALGKTIPALGPYEKLDPNIHWAKNENWRIARAMTRDEVLATEDLGKFLADL